jgi:integral membrane protein
LFTTNHLTKVALAETISWTLLLSAMVLELITGWHGGISIMGPIHGILTIALTIVALSLTISLKWPWSRFIKIMLASLIPVWGYVWIHREADSVINDQVARQPIRVTE